jgi:hypothetical protein
MALTYFENAKNPMIVRQSCGSPHLCSSAPNPCSLRILFPNLSCPSEESRRRKSGAHPAIKLLPFLNLRIEVSRYLRAVTSSYRALDPEPTRLTLKRKAFVGKGNLNHTEVSISTRWRL